jgi:hypothetical protein
MASIEIECGRSHTERRDLSFTRDDRDRIVQNFPDKIAVSAVGSGGQEFPLRPYIKTILDQVSLPTLRIGVAVHGEPDDIDSIEIDDIQIKVMGTTSGAFKVADAEITYAFAVDVMPGEAIIEACACAEGGEGHRKSRTFKCIWEIEISIDPGLAGVYEIEEFEITVTSPCHDHGHDDAESEGEESEDDEHDEADGEEHDGDDEHDDDDDDDDEGKGKKKGGKKKSKGRK